MNTERKGIMSGGVVSVILAVFSSVMIVLIIVVSMVWFMHPPVKAATATDYAKRYEEEIEPLVAKDEITRQVVANNPEKLCAYMHISDVLMGTNFCNGLEEKDLAEKLTYDPYMRQQFADRYFSYLDKKYN